MESKSEKITIICFRPLSTKLGLMRFESDEKWPTTFVELFYLYMSLYN